VAEWQSETAEVIWRLASVTGHRKRAGEQPAAPSPGHFVATLSRPAGEGTSSQRPAADTTRSVVPPSSQQPLHPVLRESGSSRGATWGDDFRLFRTVCGAHGLPQAQERVQAWED
jgi:hypothetical protein